MTRIWFDLSLYIEVIKQLGRIFNIRRLYQDCACPQVHRSVLILALLYTLCVYTLGIESNSTKLYFQAVNLDRRTKEEELHDFVHRVFTRRGVEMKNGDMKPITDDIACMDTTNDNPSGVNNVKTKTGRIDGKRKLVLHFDIRNTVLVADSVTRVSMEQALNSFLTGVAWGRAQNSEWHWHSYTPSLTPPAPGTTTIYKYLEKLLVKTPADRTNLRIATGDFTHTAMGEGFLPVFEEHLHLLRWRHDPVEHLTMSGKNGKQYHYILPSVYRVIHQLYEDGRDFSVVFRTYGLDAKNVLTSLSHGLSGNHPDFPNPLDMKVNTTHGKVYRKPNEPIVFEIKDGKSKNGEEASVYSGDREIYSMLSQAEGICAFQDDFLCWQNNNYHHRTAKPLYIDPYDQTVHHIFFDDNIRTFEHDSIVDVRVFESPDAKEARSISNQEAAMYETMNMIQADLLQAIKDPEYFVKAVRTCEEKYSKYLDDVSNGS